MDRIDEAVAAMLARYPDMPDEQAVFITTLFENLSDAVGSDTVNFFTTMMARGANFNVVFFDSESPEADD